MKSSLFQKNLLDNDTLLSAVKRANEKVGVLVSGAEHTTLGNVTTQKNSSSSEITLRSSIDRVEDRLDYDNRRFLPANRQVSTGSVPPGRTINGGDGKKKEDEDYAERKEQERAREALERKLRHDLYGEPLAEKPIPLDNGVYALDDSSGRAALRPGGPLAKNGARTRGYTDTATDSAPIQFMTGTMTDVARKHNEALSRGIEISSELRGYLKGAGIDIIHGSPEQKEVFEMVEKALIKRSVLGTITEQVKRDVFYDTWKYLYSNTQSPNGDPLPFVMEILTLNPKAPSTPKVPYVPTKPTRVPEIGAAKPDTMSDEEYKVVTDYLSPENQANMLKEAMKLYPYARREGAVEVGDYLHVLKNNYFDYMNQLNREAKDQYVAARREGDVKAGQYQQFADWATKKFYENAVMPINIKDNKYGKGVGRTVTIGELIPKEDDSFGAKIARTAFQLIGLPFEDTAKKGNRPNLEIDCQGLVRWVLAELNTDWADYAIGKGARHQINHSEKIWRADSGKDIREDIKTGDLIFWKGEETGEIKHVAIFAGWYDGEPYMVEAFKYGVTVNPVREHTTNNNGEDSYLYQVNRMIPEDLQVYADENKPQDDD